MRCYYFLSFNLVILLSNVSSRGIIERNGRWFNGAYTSTVLKTNVITSFIPSSCVQVDATLPPCRNVRYLKFPNFTPISNIQSNVIGENLTATSSLGWGEYLGIYAPMVTVISTILETKVIEDPRVTVTFAIKGCRPLQLPMDLDRCPQSLINIEGILPTSTITSLSPTTSQNIQEQYNNLIEATTDTTEENFQSMETTPTIN